MRTIFYGIINANTINAFKLANQTEWSHQQKFWFKTSTLLTSPGHFFHLIESWENCYKRSRNWLDLPRHLIKQSRFAKANSSITYFDGQPLVQIQVRRTNHDSFHDFLDSHQIIWTNTYSMVIILKVQLRKILLVNQNHYLINCTHCVRTEW